MMIWALPAMVTARLVLASSSCPLANAAAPGAPSNQPCAPVQCQAVFVAGV
jgi:hypothetical protein